MHDGSCSFFDLYHTHDEHSEPSSGYHFSATQPPLGKRRRLNPGIHPYFNYDRYHRLELEKDRCIYLEEEDDKILTPEWVEWNPAIRRAIGRLPRLIGRRLIYLAKFYRETIIYQPFEDAIIVEHLQDQIYGAYIRECRLKRAMRNIWGRWQTWRMDRRYITEWNGTTAVDPITLEPPIKPITIYSWAQRRRYTFDAKSISLHIEAQLTHHSGGFPVPKPPRNPWCNTEFPLRELISLYFQLQRAGEIRWAFQTYYTAQFHIARWTKEQRVLLVRKSLEHATKSLPHLPFLQQEVLAFIMKTLDNEPLNLERWETIYQYALEHYPQHPVIQQWITWYVESHVPNGSNTVVFIELKRIWKRQHQLVRQILKDTKQQI